jgi:hypothetical protein
MVARVLEIQATIGDHLLMSSTGLNFTPVGSTNIEKCEADFIAVVAGQTAIGETPVQILLGEAKGCSWPNPGND